MGKVIYYVAMSLDGFIADAEGGIEWLEQFPMQGVDVGYNAFYETIGAVIMGATTYEQVLTFGAYPYTNVESVILTSRQLAQPEGVQVTFWRGDLTTLVDDLKARHDKHIWVVGGGVVASAFENANLIDEYDITVIPVFLRAGIPLLAPSGSTRLQMCHLTEQQTFSNGIVRLRYTPQRG